MLNAHYEELERIQNQLNAMIKIELRKNPAPRREIAVLFAVNSQIAKLLNER